MVNSIVLAESQMAIQNAVKAGLGKRDVNECHFPELKMAFSKSDSATEFGLILQYIDSNIQPGEAASKPDRNTHADTPLDSADSVESQAKSMHSASLVMLQNKIIEASLYSATDPTKQQAILIEGLQKAQGLIKACLKEFRGSEIPEDVAEYLSGLGKVHGQIIQELSGVSANAANPTGLQDSPPGQTGMRRSPFKV